MAGTAGRSGRRPKPTARKALAGNPGKRALNKDEPVFTPIKGVEPPEWFAEEDLPLATIMWQLTTKELCGQGLLCVTDRDERYQRSLELCASAVWSCVYGKDRHAVRTGDRR